MRIPGQVTGLWDRDLILFYPLRYKHADNFKLLRRAEKGGMNYGYSILS